MIEVRLNPDVEPTGSDLAVVNAARRSFNKRSEWDYPEYEVRDFDVSDGYTYYTVKDYNNPTLKPEDKRLLQFLARGMTVKDFNRFVGDLQMDAADLVANDWRYPKDQLDFIEKLCQWRNTPTHDTPFNHCFLSFEVKAPIFVARQLVKHEYLIMSEFSRRYITDDVEFYQPEYWRKAAENKKQGSSAEPVENLNKYGNVTGEMEAVKKATLSHYRNLLDAGVAPEQARMVLPQSTMTEWTWSGTLGAFAKMCTLRLHPEAQVEARMVAEKVYEQLLRYYPVSAKALVEGADV